MSAPIMSISLSISDEDKIDRIVRGASSVGISVSEKIRVEIDKLLNLHKDRFQLLVAIRGLLESFEPVIAQTVSDAVLASWLKSGSDVVKRIPKSRLPIQSVLATLPPIGSISPFRAEMFAAGPKRVMTFPIIDEARRSLEERRVMPWHEFYQKDAAAKLAGFTVARVGSLDALEKIRAALVSDVDRGGTLEEFRDEVIAAVGRSALAPHHVETVYRTNIAAAWADGQQRVLQHPIVGSEFPFVAYEGIRDSRRRETHKWFETGGLDGTNVYWADDPTIRRFWAPWDFNCRCIMVMLTLEDAAARGVKQAIQWARSGVKPTVKIYVTPPDFLPPLGWRRAG